MDRERYILSIYETPKRGERYNDRKRDEY